MAPEQIALLLTCLALFVSDVRSQDFGSRDYDTFLGNTETPAEHTVRSHLEGVNDPFSNSRGARLEADCGNRDISQCTELLEVLTRKEIGFAATERELNDMCPVLLNGLQCIDNYTLRCLNPQHRSYFNELYAGTIRVIKDLCNTRGHYQQEYIRHAPCMRQVHPKYNRCSETYHEKTARLNKVNSAVMEFSESERRRNVITLCCSFQEYLQCSERIVYETCGNSTATFTKQFLNRMAGPIVQEKCPHFDLIVNFCPEELSRSSPDGDFVKQVDQASHTVEYLNDAPTRIQDDTCGESCVTKEEKNERRNSVLAYMTKYYLSKGSDGSAVARERSLDEGKEVKTSHPPSGDVFFPLQREDGSSKDTRFVGASKGEDTSELFLEVAEEGTKEVNASTTPLPLAESSLALLPISPVTQGPRNLSLAKTYTGDLNLRRPSSFVARAEISGRRTALHSFAETLQEDEGHSALRPPRRKRFRKKARGHNRSLLPPAESYYLKKRRRKKVSSSSKEILLLQEGSGQDFSRFRTPARRRGDFRTSSRAKWRHHRLRHQRRKKAWAKTKFPKKRKRLHGTRRRILPGGPQGRRRFNFRRRFSVFPRGRDPRKRGKGNFRRQHSPDNARSSTSGRGSDETSELFQATKSETTVRTQGPGFEIPEEEVPASVLGGGDENIIDKSNVGQLQTNEDEGPNETNRRDRWAGKESLPSHESKSEGAETEILRRVTIVTESSDEHGDQTNKNGQSATIEMKDSNSQNTHTTETLFSVTIATDKPDKQNQTIENLHAVTIVTEVPNKEANENLMLETSTSPGVRRSSSSSPLGKTEKERTLLETIATKHFTYKTDNLSESSLFPVRNTIVAGRKEKRLPENITIGKPYETEREKEIRNVALEMENTPNEMDVLSVKNTIQSSFSPESQYLKNCVSESFQVEEVNKEIMDTKAAAVGSLPSEVAENLDDSETKTGGSVHADGAILESFRNDLLRSEKPKLNSTSSDRIERKRDESLPFGTFVDDFYNPDEFFTTESYDEVIGNESFYADAMPNETFHFDTIIKNIYYPEIMPNVTFYPDSVANKTVKDFHFGTKEMKDTFHFKVGGEDVYFEPFKLSVQNSSFNRRKFFSPGDEGVPSEENAEIVWESSNPLKDRGSNRGTDENIDHHPTQSKSGASTGSGLPTKEKENLIDIPAGEVTDVSRHSLVEGFISVNTTEKAKHMNLAQFGSFLWQYFRPTDKTIFDSSSEMSKSAVDHVHHFPERIQNPELTNVSTKGTTEPGDPDASLREPKIHTIVKDVSDDRSQRNMEKLQVLLQAQIESIVFPVPEPKPVSMIALENLTFRDHKELKDFVPKVVNVPEADFIKMAHPLPQELERHTRLDKEKEMRSKDGEMSTFETTPTDEGILSTEVVSLRIASIALMKPEHVPHPSETNLDLGRDRTFLLNKEPKLGVKVNQNEPQMFLPHKKLGEDSDSPGELKVSPDGYISSDAESFASSIALPVIAIVTTINLLLN